MTSAAPPLLEVDLGAGVRACFTQVRAGGGSAGGPHLLDDPGFNLSLALGDDVATVLARRAALEAWATAPVAYARQVHGAVAHICTGPPAPDRPEEPVADADALVVVGGDVAVAVLVADCVPVLLADVTAGVAAAVHAGRRGLAAGVVQRAVGTMAQLGAVPARTRAAVGPAICGECYEVPAALQAEVGRAVPGTASTTSWGTPALDLPAGVLMILADAGVGDVQHVGACTRTDTRWYSHRRAQAEGRAQGRFAGLVSLADGARVSRPPRGAAGLA